ncbi:biotin--[acetyl-CoA-carboxylase] ligase [Novosphingobium guangzhouense]|uniref:biotin--[biotin carboxyl-carrier protein] ligase n=1 Tax=Novosphingobium guangzhouense TaxID=1850347 RepID=A0A2K2G5B0_9SPHN|nr:biotin--[acetyl-CoA-carboxylase] ligase [Novosphingobium guangzhouense]PNU06223.1 biotin--[acetyl-CoA-carboxylase] ligase [Novosphingobium guangzhouense]
MIEIVAETGSTNADLAKRLSDGEYLSEGRWLVADRQNSGRGRLGRVWDDGAGNFMGSTVVRVAPGDPSPATLALMTGLALYQALSPFVHDGLALKWPNDLLVHDAKIAGILLEMVSGVVIVGIGVNLAQAPDIAGRRTAALGEGAPSRDVFAEAMAYSFEVELQRWRTAGIGPLLRRWQAAAHPVGTPLRVMPPGERAVDGTFAGLADDGNLRLALLDGSVRTIHAGDVLLV